VRGRIDEAAAVHFAAGDWWLTRNGRSFAFDATDRILLAHGRRGADATINGDLPLTEVRTATDERVQLTVRFPDKPRVPLRIGRTPRKGIALAFDPDPIVRGEAPDPIVSLVRPDDMTVLSFAFVGFDLDTAAEPPLVRRRQPLASVIVEIGPQSIAERAFKVELRQAGKRKALDEPVTRPVDARLAGVTRIAFDASKSREISLTARTLLDWSAYALRVRPPARRDGSVPDSSRSNTAETAIEAPYRLFMSPESTGSFRHSEGRAIAGSPRTDLFRTDLVTREQARPRVFPLAALPGPDPFPVVAMSDADRRNIVARAKNEPFSIDRLALSSLGATIRWNVEWDATAASDLASWQHDATLGRDDVVRIAYHGFLFPFGHRTVFVKLTQRRYEPAPDLRAHDRTRGAFLRKELFLLVGERERAFDDPRLGLKAVRIITRRTPPLDHATSSEDNDFWPKVGQKNVVFEVEILDHEGRASRFLVPLIWVPARYKSTDIANVRDKYRQAAERVADLGDQLVGWGLNGTAGDTTLITETATFDAIPVPSSNPSVPSFTPILDTARIRLPSLDHILRGRPSMPGVKIPSADIKLVDPLQATREVFAEIVGADGFKVDFGRFGLDRLAGFASPNLDIRTLSRRFGPLSFDPRVTLPKSFGDFLGNAPRLFGIVDLKALLAKELNVPDIFEKAPKLLQEFRSGHWHYSYEWCAHDLSSVGPIKVTEDSSLCLHVDVDVPLDGSAPLLKTGATLTGFKVEFPPSNEPIVTVAFSSLDFTSISGGKPDVKPVIDSVKFGGSLGFLDGLRKGMNFGSGSSGPSIHVGLDSIEAAFGLSFPKIPLGVFNLKNLSFGAKFTLNLLSAVMGELAPRLRFNVAERDRPFLLSVGIYGGGGYFSIEFQYKDANLAIVALGVALEFGGSASIDIVLATGEVHVLGGLYFWKRDDAMEAGGYLRCGGSLRVIDLITISAEFVLTLGYYREGSHDYFFGRATLHVEVDVFFFSVPVDLIVERRFGGNSSDRLAGRRRYLVPADPSPPTIGDIIPSKELWGKYWDAFGGLAEA
jgi:hypothetical protein